MEASDAHMDDRHLEKGVNGAEDDDWSSDDENEPIPNGYVLMQNGNDSDDEESSFVAPEDFVPTADTMEGVEGDSEMPRTTTMSILKPLTAEEEAKLRKEAFENFDRNYEAEVNAAVAQAGRRNDAPIDSKGIAAAMSSVQLSYRPAWSSLDDEQADEILKDILQQHDIDWNPRSDD